jgi:hypothetical protein
MRSFETIPQMAERLYRERYLEGYTEGAKIYQAIQDGTLHSSVYVGEQEKTAKKSQAFRDGFSAGVRGNPNRFEVKNA